MADNTIAIDIRARLDGLREDLRQAPIAADEAGKNMVRALDKQLNQLEKAVRDSAKEQGRAISDGLKQAETAFGKTGSSAAKAAGLLGMFSPEAADAARTLNDFADGGEVAVGMAGELGIGITALTGATVALSAAAGVGYGVWNYYAASAQQAAEQAKYLSDTMAMATSVAQRMGDVQIDADVATGKLTHEQGAYEKAVRGATKAHEERTKKVLEEQGLTQAAWESWSAAVKENPLADTPENVRAAVTQIGLLNTELEQTKTSLGVTRDANTAARLAQEAKTEADKEAAEAQRDLAERIRETNAALATETATAAKNATTYRSGLESLMAAEDKARTAQLTGIDKIEAARRAELSAQEDVLRRSLAAVDENSSAAETIRDQARRAELATNAMYDQQVLAERESLAKKMEDLDKKAADDAIKASEAAQRGWLDTLSAAASVADSIVSGHVETVTALEAAEEKARDRGDNARARSIAKNVEKEKEAAREAFVASQGVRVSSAIADGILAEQNVLATVPYPATIPAAIAVGAMTAGNVVAIAGTKPPFHAGGLDGAPAGGGGPDQYLRPFLDGEAALSRQGRRAIGDETIQRANAGLPVATMPPVVQAQVQFGHRHYDRFVRRNAQKRGGYLAGTGSTLSGRS